MAMTTITAVVDAGLVHRDILDLVAGNPDWLRFASTDQPAAFYHDILFHEEGGRGPEHRTEFHRTTFRAPDGRLVYIYLTEEQRRKAHEDAFRRRTEKEGGE